MNQNIPVRILKAKVQRLGGTIEELASIGRDGRGITRFISPAN